MIAAMIPVTASLKPRWKFIPSSLFLFCQRILPEDLEGVKAKNQVAAQGFEPPTKDLGEV